MKGNQGSDRQWYDIVGILKVQGTNLDFDYMKLWAEDLGVMELLLRACSEAGLAEDC